jgi:hypothetical protein
VDPFGAFLNSTLSNAGTINILRPGVSWLTDVGLTNSGTINLSAGADLRNNESAGSFTPSGNFNVAADSVLRNSSGSNTFSGQVNISAGGLFAVNGGTASYADISTLSGSGLVSVSAGTLNLSGGLSLLTNGGLHVSGGAVNLDKTGTMVTQGNTLTVTGGTLNTADELTVDALQWAGGTITGSGKLITSSNSVSTLSSPADKILRNMTWDNNGTVNLVDGTLSLTGAGTSTVPAPAPIFNNLSGATLNVTSADTLPVTGSSTFSGRPTLNNSGTINWYLYGNSVNTTSFDLVNLTSGATNLLQQVDLTNASALSLTGDYSTPQTFSTPVYLNGGTLSAAGDLTINTLYWSAGTITGSGKLITPVRGSAILYGTGDKTLRSKTWDNFGTVTLADGSLYLYGSGSSSVTPDASPVVNNLAGGTLNVNSRDSAPLRGYTYLSGTATVNNAGTLNWNSSYGAQGYSQTHIHS